MAHSVKPRYDGKDSDGFANMHRLLGNKCLMFDVDRVYASLEMSMKKEDELFTEYRIENEKIVFKALFEYKYKKTNFSLEALDLSKANSKARLEMARLLGCRLFVVYGSEGRQPFEFHEICTQKNMVIETPNILSYGANDDPKEKWQNFWSSVLKIA